MLSKAHVFKSISWGRSSLRSTSRDIYIKLSRQIRRVAPQRQQDDSEWRYKGKKLHSDTRPPQYARHETRVTAGVQKRLAERRREEEELKHEADGDQDEQGAEWASAGKKKNKTGSKIDEGKEEAKEGVKKKKKNKVAGGKKEGKEEANGRCYGWRQRRERRKKWTRLTD